jgi:hypothetical protein
VVGGCDESDAVPILFTTVSQYDLRHGGTCSRVHRKDLYGLNHYFRMTNVDDCLGAVLARRLDAEAMVRIIAGSGTAEDEARLGVSADRLFRATRESVFTWTLARRVVDLSGGSLGHSRGNPLPAVACGRLGIPPSNA